MMMIDPWGLLVVSQTEDVHRQIRGLIAAARQVRKDDPPPAKDNENVDPFADLAAEGYGLAAVSSGYEADAALQMRTYSAQGQAVAARQHARMVAGNGEARTPGGHDGKRRGAGVVHGADGVPGPPGGTLRSCAFS